MEGWTTERSAGMNLSEYAGKSPGVSFPGARDFAEDDVGDAVDLAGDCWESYGLGFEPDR
jgi:hypothetical protein